MLIDLPALLISGSELFEYLLLLLLYLFWLIPLEFALLFIMLLLLIIMEPMELNELEVLLFVIEDEFDGIIDEVGFEAYNGQYLNVSIGKGIITWNGVKALAERYGHFTEKED